MNTRLRAVLVAIFFSLLFIYFGVNTYRTLLLLRHDDGWTSGRQNGRMVIREVRADGAAAGLLQIGDEVVTMQGVTTEGKRSDEINDAYRHFAPGEPYTMGVRRQTQTTNGDARNQTSEGNQPQSNDGGEVREITLRTRPSPLSRVFSRYGTSALIPFVFLLSGAIIFLLKPFDKQAILLAILLGSICVLPDGLRSGYVGMPLWFEWLMRATVGTGFLFFPPAFLHFFLVFPESKPPLSPVLRRFPRIETYLYLPTLLLFLPFNLYVAALRNFAPQGSEVLLSDSASWQDFFLRLQLLVYIGGGLVSLLVNYTRADETQRRRMLIVVLGSIAGFLPTLLQVLLISLGINNSNSAFIRWLDFSLNFLLPLMPLAFVYAILRHKVIPVSLIIRQSARYLLVARGSIILETVAVGLVIYFLMDALFSRVALGGRAVGVISGIVAIIVWSASSALHTRVVAPVINRRFFREAYDAQAILYELGQAVRNITDTNQLLELVAIKLQQALHTTNVTIFLRDNANGDYVCRLSSDLDESAHESVPSKPLLDFRANSAVVAHLRESLQPVRVDSDGADSWLQDSATASSSENRAPLTERQTLESISANLLLPLATKTELLGFVSLGERLGELPFSGEDERLLMSVAGQMAFALENARLVERMLAEERLRREVEAENAQRAKELEEARQLQLSMLPKCVPQLPCLEIAAYMKPATEVGGDYYDFHVGTDGMLTVAIGDATGHGLRAGTMVTAAKTLFSTHAHESDITHIFNESSRALKSMNLRALYMAMTMVKIKDGRMTVSAAGMPPLLVYRAARQEVEEVAIRAMPWGSVKEFPYKQQDFILAAGDTLLLMSDGFPERFNERDEMLGYEEAKRTLAEVASHTPQEIITRFVEIGDEWAGGRSQGDDVTFVVLKVKDGNGYVQN